MRPPGSHPSSAPDPTGPVGRPRRRPSERGFAMVLSALLMIPLVLAVGLAVDVGSWYLHATRMQHAADAAALAGVVYQPDFAHARDVALAEAAANGFDPTADPDISVTVVDAGNERLSVTIRDESADLFFTSSVLDDLVIQRSSVAEYLQPIPLGSPSNVFGNHDTNPATVDPEFWAAINGPYADYEQGDPYSTQCFDAPTPVNGTSCLVANPEHRADGYWYAVDVDASQVGNSIAVWAFDPGFWPRAGLTTDTGDFSFVPGNAPPFAQTTITVHDQDGTPLDYTDNPALGGCQLSLPGGASPGFQNNWVKLCDFVPTFSGIYPISIRTSGQGATMNGYSLGASLTGCPVASNCNNPRVYALGDMSLFINAPGGTAEFYLGQIDGSRAGDTFLIRAFDPGDGTGAGTYTLTLDPPPSIALASCQYAGVNQVGTTVIGPNVAPGCAIDTRVAGTSIFNGLWLEIEVEIPPTFTCDPALGDDCWWTMRYTVPGAPQDRVTFEVFSAGDPVHLVESTVP